MAEKIQIDIIANNLAEAALDAVKQKFMDIGGQAGLVGVAATAMGGAIVSALKQAVEVAQEYDQQVYELMLRTGGTADETSRLIQVVDDAGVEYGTLTTAMKFAVKNGIEPNVQSLAQLSDQYLSMNSSVARGQFLLDTFGRSGMDMTRVMVLGGDAILRMNGAVEQNLVLNEEAIAQSEELRVNIDTLKDSWDGLWVVLGNKVIPVINDLIPIMERHTQTISDQDTVGKILTYTLGGAREAYVLITDIANYYTGTTQTATEAAQANAAAQRDQAKAAKEEAEALAALEKAQENNFKNAMKYQESLENYTAKHLDLVQQRDRELATLELMQTKYKQGDKRLEDQKSKVDNLTASINALETAQSRQTDQFVLNMLAQAGAPLAVQLAYAEAAGIIDEKTVTAITAINDMGASLDGSARSAESFRNKTNELLKQLELLDGAVFTTYVNVVYSGTGSPTVAPNGQPLPVPVPLLPPTPGGGSPGRHANGGSFVIPREYGTEGFNMGGMATASGGETVTITSRGGQQAAPVVNLTYAPMFSTATRAELMNALRPMLDEWYRRRLTA